ncbi:MAG: aldo/keto reductase [Planctomycetes bacterium]|nr:aldo/keto reductase [Planctomycetota bacterium]
MKDPNPISEEVVLGTAQLGINYGITNTSNIPTQISANKLIAAAWNLGIRQFDTAQAYPNSENFLGKAIDQIEHQQEAKVVTKIHPNLQSATSDNVFNSIKSSLKSLQAKSVWGCMLHNHDMLDYWDKALGSGLRKAKDLGLLQNLGVSVYTAKQAHRALDHEGISIIQVPSNAWDHSMIDAGVFQKAKELNKIIFVRSLYLQGILLSPPELVKSKLPQAYKLSLIWHQFLLTHKLSAHSFALQFGKSLKSPLVIGSDSTEQLAETVNTYKHMTLQQSLIEEWKGICQPLVTESIINPTMWSYN